MDRIYAATVSFSESRDHGNVGMTLLVGDCNGEHCVAQVQMKVAPLEVPATPMEWLVCSLGAMSDTAAELDWTFTHSRDCEEAS